MKKINLLFVGAAVVTAAFFSSCKKDDNGTAPTVTFDNNVATATVNSGGSYTINGTAKAAGKLKSVKFFSVTGDTETEMAGTAITKFDNDTTQHFSLTVSAITADTKVKVMVTDKNDLTASSSFSIKIGTVAAGAINTYSAKLLGDVDNAVSGSFFASTTGTVYLSAKAKETPALIDFFFFYGASNLATLSALDDADAANVTYASNGLKVTAGFTTKNATRFVVSTVTKAEFTALTDDSKISTLTGLTLTKANTLDVDDVIGFVTVTGKKGLILIKAITSTGAATKDITIDVKVQK